MRLHLLVGFLALGGAAAVAACGGETDTNYGPPGEWVLRQPPQPNQGVSSSSGGSGGSTSSSSSSSSSSSGGSTGSSSGSTSGSSSGGSGSGGDAGGSSSGGSSGSSSGVTSACTVSWANQVFPAMQNDGQCGSSTSCHLSGGQLPTFLPNNATGTYNSFAQYTQLENKPYVQMGGTAATTTIDCSLDTQTCYTLVPMPSAASAPNWSTTDKDLIKTWVGCGMPNN